MDNPFVVTQIGVMPSRRVFLSSAAAVAGLVGLAPSASADTPPPTVQDPDAPLREQLAGVDVARLEESVRTLAAFGTRHTLSSQTDPLRGIGAARDWLFARFTEYAQGSQGRMTVELQSYVQEPASRIPVATTITNVVATLRGSQAPERVYVVSGHYDSRSSNVDDAVSDSPGADDDASGVAAVLEMARLMATRDPAATIVFAAVSGEEQGLYGATYLATQLKASGVDVQGMITNDIVGSPVADDGSRDDGVVRLFAEGVPTSETPEQAARRRSVGGENDSPTRQLARFVQDVAGASVTGLDQRVIYRRDRFLRGGDHIAFLEQGFPAIRLTEPAEDFAHQHQDVRVEDGQQFGDLPEFCDFDYIAGITRVNTAAIWSLATGPGTPKGVELLTDRLTNETDIVWTGDPAAAGYEVVYRETTQARWTTVVPVGDVTAVTLDISKDNVFFGVRAVNRDGRRSPVAFPA